MWSIKEGEFKGVLFNLPNIQFKILPLSIQLIIGINIPVTLGLPESGYAIVESYTVTMLANL